MSEQQLRDVLARVVPEPPDSVADASPVVRAARRQRRVHAVGMAGIAAVLVAGAVVGVRAAGTDDKDLVADDPTEQLADPYSTAPCPAPTDTWVSLPVEDLDQVTAVRYCSRSVESGFATMDGPADALVDGVSVFTTLVRGLAPADPARCAAVDPIPTDSRVLLLLADGTSAGVPAGTCQDAGMEGRALDGADVAGAFMVALGEQRDEHVYSPDRTELPGCSSQGSVSPARPGHESIVSAIVCTGADVFDGTQLDRTSVADLDVAWRAGRSAEECSASGDATGWVLAVTDRGDVLRLSEHPCGYLEYYGFSSIRPSMIPITVDDLTGG